MEEFIEGLRSGDLGKLISLPKGDFHNHCGLGMRFSKFNSWAGGNLTPPPKRMDGIRALDDYINRETMKYIRTDKDIEEVIEMTVEDAILDGVTILETSIDVHEILKFSSGGEFFKSIKKIREEYRDKIDFRPELGMSKGISDEMLDKFVVLAIDSGIFKSIDLYGNENMRDLSRFVDYYKYAKAKGMKLKAHGGEFSDAELVKNVIETLNLDEVQHGISLADNSYIMDLIKERGIRLNICPTSNYVLGAIDSIENHPIRQIYRRGLRVSINTDDLLLFNTSVSEEYLKLYKYKVLDEFELNDIRLSGLDEK